MKWIRQNEWNLVVVVAFFSFFSGFFCLHEALMAAGKFAPWPDLV